VTRLRDWVMLPTRWIEDEGLRAYKWTGTGTPGSTFVVAFLALIAIAQHAEQETGVATLTYDQLTEAIGVSRTKLAAAIAVLRERRLVEKTDALGRSGYRLVGYDLTGGWAKLPARALYVGGRMPDFADFSLRSVHEFNALKLYLTLVSRRDRKTNQAKLSYDGIMAYTGMSRDRIKGALNVLTGRGLVHVDHLPSKFSAHGVSNAYRIAHIEATRHMGTTGRKLGLIGASDV
jgi:hypothetical protein